MRFPGSIGKLDVSDTWRAEAGLGRVVGLQRRRRLGVPRGGRPPHPRCERVHAVTAVSPSLARSGTTTAEPWRGVGGLRWTPVETAGMAAAYRVNDTDRCYHCKAELMDVRRSDRRRRRATVVLGVNIDDLGDHRPGQRAGGGGRPFPLVAAGFAKADVRAASRRWGCARGTSRRGVPREPGAVRNRGVGDGPVAGRAGRSGAPGARLPAGAGAALRRPRASRSSSATWTGVEGAPRSSPGWAPATATSRSTSKASDRGTSTADEVRSAP